jgi:NitT/TauT family transport system substrate-binding protein
MKMARLTNLAKTLIAVTLIAGGAAAVFNLMPKHGAETAAQTNTAQNGVIDKTGVVGTTPYASPAVAGGADVKVSLVSFHGYAPALVANGNSLKTQPGSIYAKEGLNVEFVIQDDIPTMETIFTSGVAQCAWRTSDFWAQEQPNLRNAGHDGRAVMIVDNTQGGDAVVSRDPNIKRIEDLAGKKVALLQYTPSHGMLIDAIENSSLSARAKASIQMVFISAEDGLSGVGAALNSGSVDAAVLWDPDLSLTERKGAHVVYSTKIASNLIYDVIVCDKRFLDTPAGHEAVQKLVAGWMAGVDVAKANPDTAVDALVNGEKFFALLEKQEGRDFIKGIFKNLLWTGLDDNARILGMVGGTNHYERVYKRFDGIYRSVGALANPKSPVINPQDSIDYSFIRSLLGNNQQAAASAKAETEKQSNSFTVAAQQAAVQAAPAAVTKPVTVNFDSGSAELSKRAQSVIDKEMEPFIENNGTAYFEVSGNTDQTGSMATNMRLSRARAQATVDYLVKEWQIPRARFRVIGNGPDKPLCNEASPEAGMSLEDCRAANRTTRVAVYSAQ